MLRIFLLISIVLTFARSSTTINDPNTFDVATFNIQVFGPTKMKNSLVQTTLVKIIHRYDLVLIQEIRDSSKKAIYQLLELVNDGLPTGQQYNIVLSERLGRTSSKEQYAALYREDWVEPITSYTYADSKDVFEREPFVTIFSGLGRVGIDKFAVANIHTLPSKAQTEVDYLVDVYDDIVKKHNVKDVLIVGDFNADCNYIKIKDWSNIRLATDNRFYWLIDDTIDTTTERTDCTYDRMIAAGDKLMKALVPMSSEVLRFDKVYNLNKEDMEDVSDHYPVSIQLQSKDEMDNNKDAYQTITVHDARVTHFVRLPGQVRMIKPTFSKLNAMDTFFKVNTIYGKDRKVLGVIATKNDMEPTTLALTLKELKDSFPDLIRTSQYYKMKRLVKKNDPLRYMPQGYGRYQTSYDYYKKVLSKMYSIKIECVYNDADCWITVKQKLMD